MHVWRSTVRTPRSFSAHFWGGVGGMCYTFSFPLPATKCQPSQNPKQQTSRVTDLSHGSTSLGKAFFSVIWFGKSWLSQPASDCGYAKYASQCCAHNMWQETSQTDAHVLTRLWKASPQLLMNCGWMFTLQTHQFTPSDVLIWVGFFNIDIDLYDVYLRFPKTSDFVSNIKGNNHSL